MKKSAALAFIALLLLPVAALSADGKLMLAGAASLERPIKKALAGYPDRERVYTSFAASGVILGQLKAGAPVDVVLFADRATAGEAVKQGLIEADSLKMLAKNKIVLASRREAGFTAFPGDLDRWPQAKRIATGNPEYVPLGRYVEEGLQKTGIWTKLLPRLILTASAAQALSYLLRGEVDAAFLYDTDARTLDPEKFQLSPPGFEGGAEYFAALATGGRDEGAGQLYGYLLGEKVLELLKSEGFLGPGESAGWN